MNHYSAPLALILFLFLSACGSDAPSAAQPPATNNASTMTITQRPFGTSAEGPITQFTLTNRSGALVSLIDFGGIVTNIVVPDRTGKLADVVLGFDSLPPYQAEHPYFGALVGRYGNRIADGRFSVDGQTYRLPTNNGPNSLHGGDVGFDKHRWQAALLEEAARVGVRLTRTSPAGEQGYPGTLTVTVDYWFNNDNQLTFEYRATTDATTPVNLTNHSYFNLKGAGNGNILDHVLTLRARAFTPVDSTLIPTGEIRKVAGTPFDFTEPTAIGSRIDAPNQQIEYGGGYDHNFVLDRTGTGLESVALVSEPTTGRTLEVFTTEPGVQFYSGNFLDGSNVGKGNQVYRSRYGFCLETQHFPDSPNQPKFPNTFLQPEEEYRSTTAYKFGVH